MKRLKEAVSHSRGGSGARKRRGNGARRKSPPRSHHRRTKAAAQAEEAQQQLEAARQAAVALRKRWAEIKSKDGESGEKAVRSEAAVLIQALWRASLVMWRASLKAARAQLKQQHEADMLASKRHRGGGARHRRGRSQHNQKNPAKTTASHRRQRKTRAVGCCRCGQKLDPFSLEPCPLELIFPRANNSNRWCLACKMDFEREQLREAERARLRAHRNLFGLLWHSARLRMPTWIAAGAEAGTDDQGTGKAGGDNKGFLARMKARVAGGGGNGRSADEDVAKGDAVENEVDALDSRMQELHIEMALLLEQYPDAASTPAPVSMPKKLPVVEDGESDASGDGGDRAHNDEHDIDHVGTAEAGREKEGKEEAEKKEEEGQEGGGNGEDEGEDEEQKYAHPAPRPCQLPLDYALRAIAAGSPVDAMPLAALRALVAAFPDACAVRNERLELPLHLLLRAVAVAITAAAQVADNANTGANADATGESDSSEQKGPGQGLGNMAAAQQHETETETEQHLGMDRRQSEPSWHNELVQLVFEVAAWHPFALTVPDALGILPMHRVLSIFGALSDDGVEKQLALRVVGELLQVDAPSRLPRTLLMRQEQEAQDAGRQWVPPPPTCCSLGDSNGHLPLHVACAACNCPALVQSLVRAWPKALSMPDGIGRLPLHIAMLGAGKRVDAEMTPDAKSRTAAPLLPLPYEVVHEMVRLHPAATKHRDLSKRLPLQYALQYRVQKREGGVDREQQRVLALLKGQMKSAWRRFEAGFDPWQGTGLK